MASCTPANPLLGTETVGLPVLALVGLLGGAHCIGMCGPLVATYADRMETGRRQGTLTLRTVRQHGLFNLGRTASYTLIGGLFGLAGEAVFVSVRDVTLVATEVHAVSGVAVGLVVAGVGVSYATGGAGQAISLPGVDRLSDVVHAHLLPRVDDWVGDSRIAGLGAIHGLLPCPLLYPAYLYAFVQGSALGGAAALAALGLGTVPAVFLTGTVVDTMDVGGRKRLHRALGVAFVLLGYIPLQHGLAALGVALPAVPLPHFQPW
ncbi:MULTISPECIES: sulfite exporter TauE/SafE family protein [Salinibaculum]|uniref:sulfite exporter TauE/SafE family protein n=1 Tax=Salinibaculum TaxID=2732368 RepID=UPI0030CDCA0B